MQIITITRDSLSTWTKKIKDVLNTVFCLEMWRNVFPGSTYEKECRYVQLKKKGIMKYATVLTLSLFLYLGPLNMGSTLSPMSSCRLLKSETKSVEKESEMKRKKENRADGHRGGCVCKWKVFRQQQKKSENAIKIYTKTARELVDTQGSLPPGSRMLHPQGRM